MSISRRILVLPDAEHPDGATTAAADFTFLASAKNDEAQRITKTKRTLSFIVAVVSVKLKRRSWIHDLL